MRTECRVARMERQFSDGTNVIVSTWQPHYSANMKFRLLIELDARTKRWSAVFPELPGCGTAGDTEDEAITNAKEALALWFQPSPIKLRKNARLVELALP